MDEPASHVVQKAACTSSSQQLTNDLPNLVWESNTGGKKSFNFLDDSSFTQWLKWHTSWCTVSSPPLVFLSLSIRHDTSKRSCFIDCSWQVSVPINHHKITRIRNEKYSILIPNISINQKARVLVLINGKQIIQLILCNWPQPRGIKIDVQTNVGKKRYHSSCHLFLSIIAVILHGPRLGARNSIAKICWRWQTKLTNHIVIYLNTQGEECYCLKVIGFN